MITVRDLMRSCGQVSETATVTEVLRSLTPDNTYCLAVVNAMGILTGIITEYDLVKLVYESGFYDVDVTVAGRIPVYLGMAPEQLRNLTAAEIMTQDPDTVDASATTPELLQTMFRSKRKVVLVADRGHVQGVVHRLDVVRKVLD